LAAARVSLLSVDQINTRLQDRFGLLTGGRRTAVARQRTLEATVDWSYQLLSDVEQQLFSRLSVFPGGWALEAAEKICGGDKIQASDVLDLLSRLVSKSLVSVENEVAGERRYRFLETVRQYARERLMQVDDADRLRERHFEFFFSEFRGAMPLLRGSRQLQCLRRLRIEQENVRTALDWSLTSSGLAEKGVELAGALFWFWTKRGLFAEGKLWLERALAVQAPGPLRARALIGLAHINYFQGHFLETEAEATEALSLGRKDGDEWVVSFALFLQGLAALGFGDLEQAAARSQEAREAADASGEGVQHEGPLFVLATVALLSGDQDRAQQLYDESIEVSRCSGEMWSLGSFLSSAAALRIIRGDLERARAQASEALSLCQELEDARGIACSLEAFAGLLAARELADGAARLWGASDGLLESGGGTLLATMSWLRDRYIESVKTSLGETAFETARTEGRAMSLVQAVAFARQALLFR
jgi:predicted ATPase